MTAFATCFNKVVFPVFGWDTIIPRCPFPMGAIRSSILIETPTPGVSRWILSFGKIGVRSSNRFLVYRYAGDLPLTFSIYKRALNFSPWELIRRFPLITSPVRRPKRRINWDATYTSLSPGRKLSHRIKPYPSLITSRIPVFVTPLSNSFISVGCTSTSCLSLTMETSPSEPSWYLCFFWRL